MKNTCLNSRFNVAGVIFIGLLVMDNPRAAVLDNSVLMFDSGITECLNGGTYPNCTDSLAGVTGGSWFGHDASLDDVFDLQERVALMAHDGLEIGGVQPASGSHSGAPDGSEIYSIDEPWFYFGNTGMHYTTGPVELVSGSNGTYELDFSGWAVHFDGAYTPLGGDASVIGDNGAYSQGSGLATITCDTLDCAIGSRFVLDYDVYNGTVGTFFQVHYALHLEGVIAAVPLPAAIWMFGAGGLMLFRIGKRRCRK